MSRHSTVSIEPAHRSRVLIWDALALKGGCHIWIDGEGKGGTENTLSFKIWEAAEAPDDAQPGDIYYLACDCPGISPHARTGQMWQLSVETGSDLKPVMVWTEYKGELSLE